MITEYMRFLPYIARLQGIIAILAIKLGLNLDDIRQLIKMEE